MIEGSKPFLLFRVMLALQIICLSAPALAETPIFGRYLGLLRHERLGQEQLAKLDFVPQQTTGNTLKLSAILTLHFGDYSTGEYASYYFDDVSYNLVTGRLLFDHPDQDVTIVVDRFSNGELEARFRSLTAGEVGALTMSASLPPQPTLPLMEPIWGEYQGQCGTAWGEEDRVSLRLKTARAHSDTAPTGNPFRAFEIKGALGSNNLCEEYNSGDACLITGYDNGSYDFFRGTLKLVGRIAPLTCKVESGGLLCRPNAHLSPECRLRRTSQDWAVPRALKPPTSLNHLIDGGDLPADTPSSRPVGNPDDNGIDGEYVGFLHHEFLDRYQAARVNIMTFNRGSDGMLTLSAMANLYFGEHDSDEAISYRFDRREYHLTSPQIVFNRPENGTDAILRVTYLRSGEMRGIWYSRIFGRVGTFALRKGAVAELPSSLQRMERIASIYEDCCFGYDRSPLDLKLEVVPRDSLAATGDPFCPLTFAGWYQYRTFTPLQPLDGGSYDFYTGRISLGQGRFIGQRNSADDLRLVRPVGGAFLTELPEHELRPFRHTGR